MRPTIYGAACIIISVAFVVASFFVQDAQILGASVPLAGLSLVFLIPAIISFEYAQRLVVRKQEKAIGDLTSALSSDLKREDKLDKKVRKDVEKLVGGLRERDRELSAGLKRQESIHATDMKKQKVVNVELKDRVRSLSSDVKKASMAEKRNSRKTAAADSKPKPPSLQRTVQKQKKAVGG